MAVVANLVNPTPFDVKIEYQAGQLIRVAADGETPLTMGQLDDFRPGKPGSEETRKILEMEGVFLQDSDLSYDYQALTALKACVAERSRRIKDFTERTRNSRIAGGATVDDETMNDLLEGSGYNDMQRRVDKLVARIKILEEIVNADENKGSIRETLDPERTCFVTVPPRQFPSKTALKMFLAENPEIAAEHFKLVGETEVVPTVPAAETTTPSPSATPEGV
jgi:hypothetical protein